MTGVIICAHCDQPACVVCDDAYEHAESLTEHCSGPDCVAACAQCQRNAAADQASEIAAGIDLERCEWGPTA